MNTNRLVSSSNGEQPSNDLVSQISATILYQLLQSVPSQHANFMVLSPTHTKPEDILPTFDDSDNGSPAISVGVEELIIPQDDQMCVSFNTDDINSKDDNNSTLSTRAGTRFLAKYGNLSANESIKLNPKKRLLQRHLLEQGCEDNKYLSDTGSETHSRYSASNDAPFGRGKNGKPLTRTPFIPSYMDPKSGPFPCKVCGYKASGLHYRVMACEGCKGFFRRSVQKKLTYVCKMNNNCKINSDNRTKCQQCRWVLCLEAGMDVASVLNEDERKSKNDLIRANRQKRKQANQSSGVVCSISNTSRSSFESMDMKEKSQHDIHLKSILETIDIVTEAYKEAFFKENETIKPIPIKQGHQSEHELTNKVTIFAKLLPGVDKLSQATQNILLHNRCLDIICLYTAFSFNNQTQQLKLPSGRLIDAKFVDNFKHIEPLWNFAKRTAEYNLSLAEMAVLTALAFLVNNNVESLDIVYNQLLVALDHLMAGQSLRNSKLLIVIFSDLQVLTTRLFELRAPLGQQLLFDYECSGPKAGSVVPTVTVLSGARQRHGGGHHRRASSRAVYLAPKPVTLAPLSTTCTSPSVFSFSCGDRQL